MYITVEEFKKYVDYYLQAAKQMDVYIADTVQMTVWVLRCSRTPPLSRFAGRAQQSVCKPSNPTYAIQGI